MEPNQFGQFQPDDISDKPILEAAPTIKASAPIVYGSESEKAIAMDRLGQQGRGIQSMRNPAYMSENELLQENYDRQLSWYGNAKSRVEYMLRRYGQIPGDPEIQEEMLTIDRERHELHLQLLEIGAKLEKTERDVKVDILRDRNVSERIDGHHVPGFYLLGETDLFYGAIDLEDCREDWEVGKLQPDQSLLVFQDEIFPDDLNPTEWEYAKPRIKYKQELHKHFRNQAMQFAEDTNLELVVAPTCTHWLEEYDGLKVPLCFGYTLGVAIPNDQIEQYLAILESNPERYGILEKYFRPWLQQEHKKFGKQKEQWGFNRP